MTTYYLDTNALDHAIKAGLGSSTWNPGDSLPADYTQFLDELISRDGRYVINSVVRQEIADGSPYVGGLLEDWLDQKIASGEIELDQLTQSDFDAYYGTPNGGERSLIDITANNSQYGGNSFSDRVFISDENFTQKDFFTNAGYDESNWRNVPGLYEEVWQATGLDSDWNIGENYVRSGLKAGLKESQMFGRDVSPLSHVLGDEFRAIMRDESGAAYFPDAKAWSDLTDWVKARKFILAGEFAGAALVAMDAAFTHQDWAEALARGDLVQADEILGGLIGRTFGGAFAGAVLGAEGGSLFGLPGMIIGAIFGGFVGALGGEKIGEWLFGALGELGLNLSNLVTDLADLLRDLLADPLVLDLDGDGIELTALTSSTTNFDLDGDGLAERTGWVSPQDGLLVQDANDNGVVDGVDELFGSANVDGFDELVTLDANGDGRVDLNDPAFVQLRVWRDLNSDGVSSPDEMMTLSDAGIIRFNLSYGTSGAELNGNIVARTATYVRADGSSRAVASIQFAMSDGDDKPAIPDGTDIGELAALPNLPGLTALPDLRSAMFYDPTLKAMVENLVFGDHDFDSFTEFEQGGFLDILYRWAGIDTSVPLEDGEQPYNIQLLSAFMGRPFDDLNPHQAQRIKDEVWPYFVKELGVQFLFQAARNPSLVPFLNLGEDIKALDPSSATYLDDITSLTDAAIAATSAATPAYPYLEKFTGLSLDVSSGTISGDFNAFVAQFIRDEPSFLTGLYAAGGGGGGGGSGGAAVLGPTLDENGDPTAQIHPWTAWYKSQGSLLFNIAAAMGIDSDYVLNVTGWRWLASGMTDHGGTAENDVLDFTVTTYTRTSSDWNNVLVETIQTHDQRLFGYEGDDELRGNDGADSLIGGPGNDLLKGGSGSDMYVYASGDGLDRIVEESGTGDAIYFSSELRSENLNVSRLAGTNDLLLSFGNTSEGIILTNQWSSSATAVEQFYFVAQDGLDASDIASRYLATLSTSGADGITGSWAGERVDGLDGGDRISGGGGNDSLFGGSGNDTLSGDDGDDLLNGGTGDDMLDGGLNNDTLIGGVGDDELLGGNGDDTYVFNRGDGQDVIRETSGNDTLVFGANILPGDVTVKQLPGGSDLLLSIAGTTDSVLLSNDVNTSGSRVEKVQFADGTVLTHAELMTLANAPTSAGDIFYGSYDTENLQGGAGDDLLIAREATDTLSGGTGNDLLVGGGGNDTYVFNLGDGQDTIQDDSHGWGGGYGGTDVLQFGAGIASTDVTVRRDSNGSDYILSLNGTADQVRIAEALFNSSASIEQVKFADGTIWTSADLQSLSSVPASTTTYGTDNADSVTGGSGNDILVAKNGNDTVTGGAGNDLLIGGGGNDTYVFNRGDAQDTIQDDSHGWGGGYGGTDVLQLGAGIASTDLTVTQVNNGSDYILSINGTSDQVRIAEALSNSNASIEQVTFADGTTWTTADLLTHSTLANGGNDAFYGTNNADTLLGGVGDDILLGRSGNDTLVGGAGRDLLLGGSNNDTYIFNLGDGQDIIQEDSHDWGGGYSGTDVLRFGSGIAPVDVTVTQINSTDFVLSINGTSDQIRLSEALSNGNAAVEQVIFADGTVWAAADLVTRSTLGNGGNDAFYGTSNADTLSGGAGDDILVARGGNDTLSGGTGNDLLIGGGNDDTYVFNLGDGQDTIQDDSYGWNAGYGGSDKLQFGSGITPADVTVTQADNGTDFILSINGTTDQVRITDAISNANAAIEQVKFADGTIWSAADLLNRSMLANSGADTLYGTNNADTLSGGAGDDILVARGGNDTLSGGTGNDLLIGGGNDDTYVFNLGDGQDTIQDDSYGWNAGYGGSDKLQFGSGITPADVTVTQADNGTDFILSINGTTDQICITDAISNANAAIEQVKFADGTIWSAADLLNRSMLANSGADTLYGTNNADTLSGGAGDDILVARGGNDTLSGGTGNDLLIGGGNDDTYVFNLGDGQDTIQDDSYGWNAGYGGSDKLQFGSGITPADVTVTQADNGTDFILSINGTTDQVRITDAISNANAAIEQVKFADGTIWTAADLFTRSLTGTGGDDAIYGQNANDVIAGRDGNDALYGQNGNDILTGGTGNDLLDGGSGTDTADYSDHSADLRVNLTITASQTVVGGETDTIRNVENVQGGSGNDSIVGTSAANDLKGGDGDDRLTGGAGNDNINGGNGTNDVAVFAGLQETYSIVTSGGAITIVDTQSSVDGNDGTDTITGIEKLEFKDGTQVGVTSPIILDLDGNGITTLSASQSCARYDLDGDGLADDTSWIGKTEGFLFLDRDGNGTVSSAGELSFVDDLPGATSDLVGLAAFDSNGDGKLSSTDERYGEFGVWQDRDGNGSVGKGEIFTLGKAHVASIDLAGTPTSGTTHFGDVAVLNTGTYTRTDGAKFGFIDAALTYLPGEADTASATPKSIRRGFGSWFANPRSDSNVSRDLEDAIEALSAGKRASAMSIFHFGANSAAFDAFASTESSTMVLSSSASAPAFSGESPAKLDTELGDRGYTVAPLIDGIDTGMDSARILALLRQDMAAFGAGTGIDSHNWTGKMAGRGFEFM